jgi:hypothetical protein
MEYSKWCQREAPFSFQLFSFQFSAFLFSIFQFSAFQHFSFSLQRGRRRPTRFTRASLSF